MKRILSRLRSRVDRLGIRLALVLAVALLPLMTVSILRSQSVVNSAIERSQAALFGETLSAVQTEALIIERAKAVAQSLSHSILAELENPELCSQHLRKNLTDTMFSFVGYYDTSGNVICSSAPEPFSVGMTPALAGQLEDPKPTVLVSEQGRASGTSIIYASHPVVSEDGTLTGFTAVSIPHHRLRQTNASSDNASFLTLTASGTLLTAPETLDEARLLLPQLHPGEAIISKPKSFNAIGGDGVKRLYALVPIVEGELYALSTWSQESQQNVQFHLKDPAFFPAMMWFASLGVAWFAASLFVTRHVSQLRRAMQDFAKSRKTTTPGEFRKAPGELREVADTFIGMTDTILHDEAQIEDALRQKDILLREVHHRVKNNLQLIASIMSMQMRQSRSKEVHRLMRGLHDRVNSLATIHRNLYQTTGQADVSMDEHLDAIVRQVMKMAAARDAKIELKTDFADLRLNPDQAVPLSLFVTEAVTNSLKYIGSAEGETPTLSVTLTVSDDEVAKVSIVNSVPPKVKAPDAEKSSGLGSELMEAFSEQLSGSFSTTSTNAGFRVDLEFPVEPLSAKN